MIRKVYQYSVLFFALASCTATISIDDNITPSTPTTSTISDQLAQGKVTSSNPFVLKIALYRSHNMFGKDGYLFSFYDKTVNCKAGLPPISFFVTKLESGKGEGPYFYYYKDANNFGTSSYMGCEVVITKVTATTVEGKVKGGDTKQNQYIEGTFSATLCK